MIAGIMYGLICRPTAERKSTKYGELSAAYEFQPVAVETHGPMDEATISFISELARKISEYSGDSFDSRYFFQRVIVLNSAI